MNAGAIIVMQQRKAVRAFEERGCTTPERARALEELNVRRSFAIRGLIRQQVLCEVASDRFYLDRGAWQQLEQRRRRLILGLLAIGVVVAALVVIFNN